MEKNYKIQYTIVYTGQLARHLLRLGYPIIDVMPHNEMPAQTVFAFEYSRELKDAIKKFKEKKHANA